MARLGNRYQIVVMEMNLLCVILQGKYNTHVYRIASPIPCEFLPKFAFPPNVTL